jgi:hypothetical protein
MASSCPMILTQKTPEFQKVVRKAKLATGM